MNALQTLLSIATVMTVAVSSSLAAPAATTPAPAAPATKAPAATILFLDRTAVLRQSAVGKDMALQVDALVKKMEADFSNEGKKLQSDAQALQGPAEQPEVLQAKIKDLETRRNAFQKKVKDRQASIQAGVANARSQVEKALGPILQQVLIERGANLLLDLGLVVWGQTGLDITGAVVSRLNVALPKVTATPAAPPAARTAGAQPKPPAAAATGH